MKRPPTVRTRAEKAAINGAAQQEAGENILMKVNGVGCAAGVDTRASALSGCTWSFHCTGSVSG